MADNSDILTDAQDSDGAKHHIFELDGTSQSSDAVSMTTETHLDLTDPSTPVNRSRRSFSSQSVALDTQQRRSSSRSIKRKKFDDELVESSLIKSERTGGHGRSLKLPPVPVPMVIEALKEKVEPVTEEKERKLVPVPLPQAPEKKKVKSIKQSTPQAPIAEKKWPSKPFPSASQSSKRSKRQKPPALASTKDLGRWKPQDDLALISAVQQTNDLSAVHIGVKFSCHFTLKEIQERWYALLYDPIISKLAMAAIKQLHPDIINSVNSNALYHAEEEALLGTIASSTQPTEETFQDLLDRDPDTFHPQRTAKALHSHWLLMKQYHLLPDQSVQPMPRGDHVLNFSDAEDLLDDDQVKDPSDDTLEHELAVADRRNKKEIRHLEQELPKWQVLVDTVIGISPPDFDNQTLAVLRGRLVRYLMRSREITLGRAAKGNQIDVDLSLEGPAWKISRRQGVIKLRTNGDFYIANEGKRPIYVDGKPILTGNKQKMCNNSVVEISGLRFIFLVNQDLINVIRTEAHKS